MISRFLLLLLAYFAFFTVLVAIQFPREDLSAWIYSPREVILSSEEDRLMLLGLGPYGADSTEEPLYADD